MNERFCPQLRCSHVHKPYESQNIPAVCGSLSSDEGHKLKVALKEPPKMVFQSFNKPHVNLKAVCFQMSTI